MKRTTASLLSLVVAAAIAAAPATAQTECGDQEDAAQKEREQKLHAMLQGASLVGQFSVIGTAGAAPPPQPEQYAVSRLERDAEGRWVFNVSMSYAAQQHTMPVPVTIEWAGDTPMITMTEQTIPGLGTFSARVLLYDGLYAGTWKHGQFGGHMWGKIEPGGSIPAPVSTPAAAPSQPAAPPPG